MRRPKDTPNRDQERIEAIRLVLRDWRPTQASRPWERPEHRDRRLVVVRRAAS